MTEPSLLLLIPAYNEEARIEPVLRDIDIGQTIPCEVPNLEVSRMVGYDPADQICRGDVDERSILVAI